MRVVGFLSLSGLLCAPLHAAMVPFWRVNPINAAAVADAPVLANAISVSLMVEITGTSQFSNAGFDFRTILPSARYYHRVGGGGMDNIRPLPEDIALSPALEFDTYWTAPNQTFEVTIPSRYNGPPGPPQLGRDNFVPPTGPHRVGQNINMGWNNEEIPGPIHLGTFEIARVTMVDVLPGFTLIPSTMGHVADALAPANELPLPPIPVVIPEPGTALLMALFPMLLKRRASDT